MATPGWSSTDATTLALDPRAIARNRTLRALGSMALLVLGFLLFWPTTAALIEQWEDTVRRSYTHGYLIVAMSLWMLWWNRAAWSQVEIRPSVLACSGVLAASVVWLIVYRAGIRIGHEALLPVMIFGAFVAGYGLQAARRNWLPFAFLYFAIPLWDAINPLLQSLSTFAVRMLLRTAGIPAFFSGNTFTLPAGSLEIAGGCSGLHFLIVGIAIAVLYGELNRDPWWTRVKLVVLAAVLAMLTNWIRIFIIAVAAHVTDMQHYLVTKEHYSFGWVMFVGTMVIFFLIVRRWPAPPEAQAQAQSAPKSGPLSWRGAALALISLLVAPVWLLADRNTIPKDQLPRLLPATLEGWSADQVRHDDWQPVFEAADMIQRARYSRADHSVEGYAALYGDQHQGKELVAFNNSISGETLNVRRRGRAGHGPWMEVEATDSSGARWLVWSAYRLDEVWHDDDLTLQIQYGVRSLVSAPLSAVVAFRTRCQGEDCSAARDTLRDVTTSLAASVGN
ncbi:exosortase A [Steroidobacter cummioxidans]|uniref:exosortase A n=1 Tax=Steroidobacter cummioxidans TaxID=1803913 RepID=UPI000E30DB32|nr:exosortase A [Steroidobacter cummioxidans]